MTARVAKKWFLTSGPTSHDVSDVITLLSTSCEVTNVIKSGSWRQKPFLDVTGVIRSGSWRQKPNLFTGRLLVKKCFPILPKPPPPKVTKSYDVLLWNGPFTISAPTSRSSCDCTIKALVLVYCGVPGYPCLVRGMGVWKTLKSSSPHTVMCLTRAPPIIRALPVGWRNPMLS